MAIVVVCHGCHARFQVSEKFAGKEGPCPKCKVKIKIPALEDEIKIHAPEEYAGGGKDAKGRPVLKPIARVETKAHPVVITGSIAGVLATVAIAWLAGRAGLEGTTQQIVLAIGAVVVAPPLVIGAYTFLRNQELEPYSGKELLVRATICSIAYAGLWGAIWAIKAFVLGTDPMEAWSFIYLAGPPIVVGSLVALATLDLDFGSGFMHYCCYLLATVLLRLAMGLSAF